MSPSQLGKAVLPSIVALGLLIGVNVYAWTNPTQNPPNGNVPAPINVSNTPQVKNGSLGVNSLAVYGNSSVSGSLSVTGDTTVNNLYTNQWFRVNGNNGIYWQNWGGGWFMQDPTWIRAYNNKDIYTGGIMRADNQMRANTYCDVNGNNCFNPWNVSGSAGVHNSGVGIYQCPNVAGYRGSYGTCPTNCTGQIQSNNSQCVADSSGWSGGGGGGGTTYCYATTYNCTYLGSIAVY